jgi:hypothetical protein
MDVAYPFKNQFCHKLALPCKFAFVLKLTMSMNLNWFCNKFDCIGVQLQRCWVLVSEGGDYGKYVFWFVTQCSSETGSDFGGICHLHLQAQRTSQLRNQQGRPQGTHHFTSPRWLRRYISPKHTVISELLGVTIQKAVLSTATVLTSSTSLSFYSWF